jgi:hypothetical protein
MDASASADRELYATAYHEAGHAVAAFAVGRTVPSIRVRPGDGFNGRVMMAGIGKLGPHGLVSTLRQRNIAEKTIIVCLAGGVAEKRFRADGQPVGDDDDREKAGQLLTLLGFHNDAQRRLFGRYLRRVARDVLAEHWYLVVILAGELVERGSMSGRAARGFLVEHRKLETRFAG